MPSDNRTSWLVAAGLAPTDRPLLHRLGLAAWSALGVVALAALVVVGLAAVSAVLLPLLFAVVLAVLFRPAAARLERRGVPPWIAAGAVVLGLVLLCIGVLALTVRGIVDQADRIVDEVTAALEEFDVDDETIADVRASLEDLDPSVASGLVKVLGTGLSAIGAFVVGALLGVLIMYYLIRDGGTLRQALISRASPAQAARLRAFIADTCFVLRRYWLGRTIVSAVVAAVVGIAALVLGLPLVLTLVVVTFVGGYIPYVGAVLGGLLAVIVALGSEGLAAAAAMLVVVLTANLVIENLVEPVITGRTLQIHPLVVLLVTTIGGIVGGLVGLVMAVPLAVIGAKALPHLHWLLEQQHDAAGEPQSP